MFTSWVKNFINNLNIFFLQTFSSLQSTQIFGNLVNNWTQVQSISDTPDYIHKPGKVNLHSFFLFNSLGADSVGTTININYFSVYVFNLTNVLNYTLKNNTFFWWYSNVSLDSNLKNTEFYNNVALTYNNPNTNKSVFDNFLVGINSTWLALSFWVVPVYLGLLSLVFMSYISLISFNIFFVNALILFGVFYWLLSGFTFFLKNYQYSYFTSSLQSFWNSCYAIFWMLEFFTLSVFIYLTMMGSQEPFFMYDNSQFFNTHLFSWKLFLVNIFLLTSIILLTYFIILTTNWSIVSNSDVLLISITFILLYITWVEFYQFFHVLAYYGNYVWNLSEDTGHWFLENEYNNTRISNHFVTICLIAKFWHIVFTIVFWLFFVVSGLEVNKLSYPLLVANFQNFIFIYVLTWVYMYPWINYVFLNLFNTPYYWFFVNTNNNVFFVVTNDLYLYTEVLFTDIVSLVPNTISSLLYYKSHFNFDFFYLHESSGDTSFSGYSNNYIRDVILNNLN